MKSKNDFFFLLTFCKYKCPTKSITALTNLSKTPNARFNHTYKDIVMDPEIHFFKSCF